MPLLSFAITKCNGAHHAHALLCVYICRSTMNAIKMVPDPETPNQLVFNDCK